MLGENTSLCTFLVYFFRKDVEIQHIVLQEANAISTGSSMVGKGHKPGFKSLCLYSPWLGGCSLQRYLWISMGVYHEGREEEKWDEHHGHGVHTQRCEWTLKKQGCAPGAQFLVSKCHSLLQRTRDWARGTWPVWLSWLEHRSVHQKVAGSISWGVYRRQLSNASLSQWRFPLSPFLPLLKKIN